MTSIESVILEVPDPATADAFYTAAFGLGARLGVRHSEPPTTGFRGFTLSLVVSQPSTVDSLIGSALEGGATPVKPAAKGFWGYGGVVRAPDGAIWKVATSSKKDTGPATREIDDVVLLLGVSDVKASKRFYVDHGLAVARSFGSKYVEFASSDSHVKMALYARRALAKDAGVPVDGSGSHRIVISSDAGAFTDPDGARIPTSRWRSTHAVPWPRTPAFPWTAAGRTGSSSVATPEAFTDPDGFAWESAPTDPGRG